MTTMVSPVNHSPESDSTEAVSPRKRQSLFAAAGAVMMAVHQNMIVSPTVFFPGEEDEEIYSSPSIYEKETLLQSYSNFGYGVEAAFLAAGVVRKKDEIMRYEVKENDKIEYVWYEMLKPGEIWFNTYLLAVLDEDRWIRNMKMCRRTFMCLVEYLRPALMRDPKWIDITVERRIGATIYRLVNATDIEELGEKFAMDSLTTQGVIAQIVLTINWELRHLITWPKGEAMKKVTQGFGDEYFPNCCGVLGSCHIPVISVLPSYRNKNGTFSIILQAVCDSQNKFLDVGCGWPGCTRPTRALKNSIFVEKVNRKEYLSGPRIPINSGFGLRQYVIGDELYPSLPWLLTPYDEDSLTYLKKHFNKKQEQCSNHIVQAFNSLKDSFRLLAQPTVQNIEFLPHLVFTSCILHNFLIDVNLAGADRTLLIGNLHQGTLEDFDSLTWEESADTIRAELAELMILRR